MCIASLCTFAQRKSNSDLGKTYNLEYKRGMISGGYNFLVTTPYFYNDSDDKMPLVVFLHGKSLCGTNLDQVRKYGTIDAVEKGLQLEAVCVAPQNPGGSWNPRKILEVVEWMEKNYRIESTRIFVIGMSLGGYGTLDFVNAYPEKVAAAMAMGGGSTAKTYEGLSKVPLWIVHGSADQLVPVNESRKVVNGIRNNFDSSLLIYTELPGVNHGRPARLFYQLDTYDWLFSHTTLDRRLDKTFIINNATLNRSYNENMQRGDYPEDDILEGILNEMEW